MSARTGGRVGAWVALLRARHWIKNLFVLAPLLFSQQFRQLGPCGRGLLAFGAFCLAASAVYVLNDVCDRREDQQHPVKRRRPVAAGQVGAGEALLVCGVLAGSGVALGAWAGGRFLLLLWLYLAAGAVYSLGLKHVAILDVMAIAAGFVLRILGGSAAIAVTPSHWLILCTIMISLFLGFTKRRAELTDEAGTGEATRKVLADYSVTFLDQAIAIVTGATIVCYALYTVDAHTVALVHTRALLLTAPVVLYGLFRYLYLVYHLQRGGDPTTALWRDGAMLATLWLWVLLSAVIVSRPGWFSGWW